ncbi:MAG: glucose ABC transporter substrate-binding protein GlcS [Caldisphaera sp.]
MIDRKKGLSKGALYGIIVVIIVVVIVGGVAAYYASRKPTTTTPTTTTTSTTTSIPPVTTTTTTSTTTSIPPVTTTTTTPPVTTFSFLNWWGPEDPPGLKWIAGNFSLMYPQYQVSYTSIPGAGGTVAQFVILGMIEAQKPPNSFQAHYSPVMWSYVEVMPQLGKDFVNFTPIAQQTGFYNLAVREGLLAGMFNGTMFSLPLEAHRGVLLYYNPQLLRKYNISYPIMTVEQLINDTEYLASKGVTNIWVVPGGDGGWDQLNLWEDIFLGLASEKYGPDGGAKLYNEILYGVINLSDPSVQALVNQTDYDFLLLTKYDYSGWQTGTWSSGLANIINGQAFFQANGNWVTEYAYIWYHVTAYAPVAPYTNWTNVTLMEQPFPGTWGNYAVNEDSMAVPSVYNPYMQAAVVFAKFWNSYNGMKIWTSSGKGVEVWSNGTDFYPTTAQWYDYVTFKNISATDPGAFTIDPSDESLFTDTFSSMISQALALQNGGTAYIATFNSQFASIMHQQCLEWQTAAQNGFGFLGMKGQPFANYLPPWVNPTTYTYVSGYTCPTY